MYGLDFEGVHPQAIVAPGARLGAGAQVGPFAVVGANVELGAGAIVHPHAVIDGRTKLGPEVEVYPGAAVGLRPQDRKYDGSATELHIGVRTVIRECATLQPGTSGTGCGVTRVGDNCLIMAYVHVAHDCWLGDNVIVANGSQIAGHVHIDDHAILGGVTTVHQFVRIGTRAITGASARVLQDIAPYTKADGHPARLYGLNSVGLRRASFSGAQLSALKGAYKAIFVRGPYAAALGEVERTLALECAEVAALCRFLRATERGVARAHRANPQARQNSG